MESNVQENSQSDSRHKTALAAIVEQGEEDLPSKCNSRCCWSDSEFSEGHISLGKILATYDAPINEEHAWALCYLSAKCLETHSLSSNTSSHESTHISSNSPSVVEESCCCTELIKIRHQDGYVVLDVEGLSGNDAASNSMEFQRDDRDEKDMIKSKVIAKIALIIYKALDFGMTEDEERSLSIELERLLDRMASCVEDDHHDDLLYKEHSCSQIQRQQPFTLHDIINACLVHYHDRSNRESTADSFYREICKNLALDTLEFSKFIRVAEQASETLKYLCLGGNNDLPKHNPRLREGSAFNVKENLRAVAKIWIHVVRELRRGVKLKRLDDSVTSGQHECKKSPYEMLMEDIKCQKYKLRKVPAESKAERSSRKFHLHDAVMEYIRSRPKLRNVSERILKPAAPRKTDPYEELMESIRQVHHLRPVAAKNLK